MTRLLAVKEEQQHRIIPIEAMPEELRDLSQQVLLYEWYIYAKGARSGTACVRMGADGTALIEFSSLKIEERAEQVACVVNRIIRELSPLHLIVFTRDEQITAALSKNLFHNEGTYYRRDVEKWRLRLDNACFDDDGFLIHQGLMQKMPFGFFSTGRTGCAWIAAYNLLKACGKEMTMESVERGIAHANPAGGIIGQDIFSLYLWLKKQGLDVNIDLFGEKRCLKDMNSSSYGILLYSHAKGSHYTAYRKERQNRFHFWNAVYGQKNMILSAEKFFETYSSGLKYMLIWMK